MLGSQVEYDEGVVQVGVDYLVEVFQVVIGDFQVGYCVGVVDYYVDVVEGVFGGFEQFVYVFCVGYVVLYGDGCVVGGDDFGYDFVGYGLVVGIVDCDCEIVGGQLLGNGVIDVVGGVGDDGGLGDVRYVGIFLE